MENIEREHLEVQIVKAVFDIQVIYACADQEGLAIEQFEHPDTVSPGELRIEFGVDRVPDNGEITQRMHNTAAGHIPQSPMDVWPMRHRQMPWRGKRMVRLRYT
jgi:hypothetical protein